MLSRFFLAMLSSWVMNPLAILVAQSFGVANNPVVIAVLLATGACVPIQLLVNECIAAAEMRGRLKSTRIQLGALLAMQFGACVLSVAWLAKQDFPLSDASLIAILLVVSTSLSYKTSVLYFRLVMVSAIDLRISAVVGATPGIASLVIYLTYCGVASWYSHFPSDILIIASTVLPAIVQWRYVQSLSMRSDNVCNLPTPKALPKPSTFWLFAAAIVLSLLAASSTRLREEIAHFSTDYFAVVLVALNALLGLINTLTRVSFLKQPWHNKHKWLIWAVVGVAAASTITYVFSSSISLFLAFLCAQLAVATVIESARQVPVAKS